MRSGGNLLLLFLLATTRAQNGTVAGDNICDGKDISQLLRHIDEGTLKQFSSKIETKAMVAQVQENVNKVFKQLQETNTKLDSVAAQLNKLDQNVDKAVSKGATVAAKLYTMEISCNQTAHEIEQKRLKDELDSKPSANWQVLLQEVRSEGGVFFTTPARKIYYLVEAHINWYGARDACKRKGMKHATPRSQTELEDVANAHSFWVSVSDIGHAPGQFHWADGHAVDHSLWNAGEPNTFGAGKETCAELNSGTGKLNDLGCAPLNWSILCEVL